MNVERRPRLRALRLTVATFIGASALLAVPQSTSAEPAPDQPTVVDAPALIDEPLKGAAAVKALGDDLDVAADRNDLGTSELRTLLRQDTAAWVDTDGIVFYVDPAPAAAAAAAQASAATPAEAAAPLTQTFSLHSNPGANLTILLDFDGATVSGTQWNAESGVSTAAQPAWDPAGNGAMFSNSELLRIQQIWAMVAEDYAPFNVDVTTQDPGAAGILRSSSADTVYGTRVLITPSDDAFDKICSQQCGGVAYLGAFGETGGSYQPAWVFPQALRNDTKAVAEAASHEAGHNFGLEHDGNSTEGYDMGHGIWAPIMGAGYDRPLVQWSNGSYTGANNDQDDIAIITGLLGARPDEASGSVAAPSRLPTGPQTIGTRTDVDAYLLGACAANSQVTIAPAATAPNLDVRAVLYDGNGVQQAVSQPASSFGDGTTADGLGATLTMSGVGDGWVVTVEGVGEGSWAADSYDDYGSLGMYTVTAPGCDGGVPSAPTSVKIVRGDRSARLSWTAPAANGSPITGYTIRGGPSTVTTSGTARSVTLGGLTNGRAYRFTVTASNGVGQGAASASATVVPSGRPATVSRPTAKAGKRQATIVWRAPSANGSAITSYAVRRSDGVVRTVKGTARSYRWSGLKKGKRYSFTVTAVNQVGPGRVSSASTKVRIR